MVIIFFITIPKSKINSKPVNPFGDHLPVKGAQPGEVVSNYSAQR
jgi:hypothetical protein